MRVHGGLDPLPPINPKLASILRLQKSFHATPSTSTRHSLHLTRDTGNSLSVPLPTSTSLKICSWNVEGLHEVAKYDSILHLCNSNNISLLCAQQTKVPSSSTFVISGWEILHSGSPQDKHHGVGFFVSPRLRAHVHSFIPHSARICELTLNLLPHPVVILSVYAPSQVEDAQEDLARKTKLWSHLESILLDKTDLSHVLLVGDFNSRLDTVLDTSQTRIGPAVIGKRQALEDDDRDNAVSLLNLLDSLDLSLLQTFSKLPFRRRVTYKEMSCTDHLLHSEDVNQWTCLD